MQDLLTQIDQTTGLLPQLWFLFSNGGWIVLAGVVIFILYELYIEEIQHQFMARQEWVFLSIRIPKTNQLSTLAVEQIFTQMHAISSNPSFAEKYVEGKTQVVYSLEIVSLGGKTSFIIRAPKKQQELVEAAFYAQYPGAEIGEVQDYLEHFKYDPEATNLELWGAEFTLTEHFTLPIRTYREFEHPSAEIKIIDPLKPLFEGLNAMKPHEMYAVQVLIRPISDDHWKPEGEEKARELILGKGDEHGGSLLGSFLGFMGEILAGVIVFFTPPSEEGHEEKGEDKKPDRHFSKLPDVRSEEHT